jgi:hypothetical protein
VLRAIMDISARAISLADRPQRAIRVRDSGTHPPVQYSQYRMTITVPVATNAKRVITIRSRRESLFIFPTLKGRPSRRPLSFYLSAQQIPDQREPAIGSTLQAVFLGGLLSAI